MMIDREVVCADDDGAVVIDGVDEDEDDGDGDDRPALPACCHSEEKLPGKPRWRVTSNEPTSDSHDMMVVVVMMITLVMVIM